MGLGGAPCRRPDQHVGDPLRAYLPFDVDAAGYVPGDGGALFVLEARKPHGTGGVTSWHGEIAGYAAHVRPAAGFRRPSTLRRAIELALADANIGADEIDVVFADGSGLPDLDRVRRMRCGGVRGRTACRSPCPRR